MLQAKGTLLTIDLNDRSVKETSIDDRLRTYMGGRGVATKLAHDRIPFDADPLGPENRLYFSSGPLQVSRMSYTGRMNATTLSPLTDGLISTNAGGFLSRHFSDTGYAVVELVGNTDELVAVHISETKTTFEAVPELEASNVPDVSEYMEDAHDIGSEQLVTIGPAGENQVRYASMMTYDSRAFGRGGAGAVLGAKNVKAVSFGGNAEQDLHVPADISGEIHRDAATKDHIMKRQGTTSGVDVKNDLYSLPTKYFEKMSFDQADQIDGSAVESKKYKKESCSVCAFACKLPTKDDEAGVKTEGPEYETVFSFGSNLMEGDLVSVMRSNELCDTFGLDTISTGVAIGAYLAAEDRFGDTELIHNLIERIAYREGVGDILAEGVDQFADDLGVDNWTSKGMEFPGHDGRVLHGRALGYATANRGADHMYSKIHNLEYDGLIDPDGLDGKPALVAELENLKAVNDSAIICKFSRSYMDEKRYEALFGTGYDELLASGSKIIELERHFNNQRGFDRTDDTLPFEIAGFDEALDEYYRVRGWNQDGTVPSI